MEPMLLYPRYKLAAKHFQEALTVVDFERVTGRKRTTLKERRHRGLLRTPVPASAARGTKPYRLLHAYESVLIDACASLGVGSMRASDFFFERAGRAILAGGEVDFARLPVELTKRDGNDLAWWVFGKNGVGSDRDLACQGKFLGPQVDILRGFVALDVTTTLNEVDRKLFDVPDIHAGEQVD